MKATDKQVDGRHYIGMAIQPADFIVQNGLGYLEGNVIKYVCRHGKKGRRADLEKAIHYLEMLIEQEYPRRDWVKFNSKGEAVSIGYGSIEDYQPGVVTFVKKQIESGQENNAPREPFDFCKWERDASPESVSFEQWMNDTLTDAGEDPASWTRWIPTVDEPFELGRGQAPIGFGDLVRVMSREGRIWDIHYQKEWAGFEFETILNINDIWTWNTEGTGVNGHVVAYRILWGEKSA